LNWIAAASTGLDDAFRREEAADNREHQDGHENHQDEQDQAQYDRDILCRRPRRNLREGGPRQEIRLDQSGEILGKHGGADGSQIEDPGRR